MLGVEWVEGFLEVIGTFEGVRIQKHVLIIVDFDLFVIFFYLIELERTFF